MWNMADHNMDKVEELEVAKTPLRLLKTGLDTFVNIAEMVDDEKEK